MVGREMVMSWILDHAGKGGSTADTTSWIAFVLV